ncbi:MAG: hypothetical protein ABI867_25265 [Kofleriaceae bacterium]
MPSFDHEILVELFRGRARLAPELLRLCAGLDLPGDSVELGSIDLSQIAPTEYRSDVVSVLYDRGHIPTAAVITEVQRRIDRDKLLRWPVYVTALRARLGCSVTLLVLGTDDAVVTWARRPIELGHPGFTLRPVVLSLQDIPTITDLDHARRNPELAVLSVMAHGNRRTADVAVEAIQLLDSEHADLYFDVINAVLPERAHELEESMLPKGFTHQSEAVRLFFERARNEGRNEGRANGLRKAIAKLVVARHGHLPVSVETAVSRLVEPALEELFDTLVRAEPSELAALLESLAEPAA